MKPRFIERIKSLFTPTEELEAHELRCKAKECGAQPIAECELRSKVSLRGQLISVTSDTRRERLEAELSDGSGIVSLVWMGRSHLECLVPGATLRVHGRLAQDGNQLVMYNPEFEVIGKGR